MSFYRMVFGNNLRLINLKNVSSIQQSKNKLTITYNFNTSEGLLILGSGFIDKLPHTETLTCENELDACKHIDSMHNQLNSYPHLK
jgi:hypothetical protein